MKIAILGYSREGSSTLAFLKKQKKVFGQPQNKVEYWILDQNKNIKPPRGVQMIVGSTYLNHLSHFDIVIRSPGIPYMAPKLVQARKKGVQFTSATKIFFDHCPGKIIGITGTKGKGTTATILYRILKAAGKKVFLVGNIGTPALDLLPKIKKDCLVVFELSSFQLQDLKKSPPIALVLGISPDHLDSHRSLQEYIKAKSSIAAFQKKTNTVFYDSENTPSSRIAHMSPGNIIPLSLRDSSPIELSDLYLPARHLLLNTVFAARTAQKLGVDENIIKKIVRAFRGTEHRLELVSKRNTLSFYNDSAATNPISTIAAIRSLPRPLILIAGGKNKGFDYRKLGEVIDSSGITKTILIGENQKQIASTIHRSHVVLVQTLSQAVREAVEKTPEYSTILFSPGSASFDMFNNYQERGNEFRSIVQKLNNKYAGQKTKNRNL